MSNAPDPRQRISMHQAMEETGLSRTALYTQYQLGRLVGTTIAEPRGGAGKRKHYRKSGGGKTVLFTRAALHEYLLTRNPCGAKPVKASYRAPAGMPDTLPRLPAEE